jgi:hypothetical protein
MPLWMPVTTTTATVAASPRDVAKWVVDWQTNG